MSPCSPPGTSPSGTRRGRSRAGGTWGLLEQLYQAFIDAAAPALARWRAQPGDPGQAFADDVRVLTGWRRLPFLDPGLSPELLPADWHGARAAALFGELRDRLAGKRSLRPCPGRQLSPQPKGA